MRRRGWMVATTLALAGCGPTQLDLGSGPSEPDELAAVENRLGARVRDLFGPEATVRAVFGRAERQVLAVGMQALPEETDALPAVALATFEKSSGALEILEAEPDFREARIVGDGAAVVRADGELRLRTAGGDQLLAVNARGELTATPDGRALAFTLLGPSGEDGETAVALVDLSGELTILADGDGADDRPAVSPDGKTVVFVSGRTGIASLFRTSVHGEPAVQLTNLDIDPGVDRDGEEGDPEGFVPPPVNAARMEWVDADLVRYDAGGGDWWQVNVRSGLAVREGGVR